MSGRYRRLVDLVELTGLLQTTTSGLSIDQIAGRFDVSRRTAERMLEALRERFPKLEPQLREGRKYWMLPRGEHGRALELPGELEQLSRRVVELEAMIEQNAMADQVLKNSPIGIVVLDSKFRVVWVNAALEQLFGIAGDDVVGHDKRKLIEETLARKFENGEEFKRRVFATYDDNSYDEHFRCRLLPTEGRPARWLEHWSRPIEVGAYAGGRLEHYVEFGPPTPRPSSAAALLESAASALASVDVTDSASDLLPAPLAHLIETARQGLEGPRDANAALEEIRDVAGQLQEQVAVSPRSAATGELHIEHVEAGSLLREVADRVRSSAERAGVEVRIGEGSDAPIRFMADSTLLVLTLVDLARAEIGRLAPGGALELVASRVAALDCVSLGLRVRPAAGTLALKADPGAEGVDSARSLARAMAREIVVRHEGDISVMGESDGRAPTYSLQLPASLKR